MANSDDLDLLLDSALDDFTKLDLASSRRGGDAGKGGGGGDNGGGEVAEASSSSSLGSVRGLGMGLPDPRKGKGKRGMRGGAASSVPKGASAASEALEKLTRQTREAVLGLGTATIGDGGGGGVGIGSDLDRDKMMEDFVKHFEELSGSQDMESIVETMMQQLLSKEILHEPMQEIAERYPAWLQEHKTDLSLEDYDRYTRQFKLIEELNEVFEHEPNNFTKIVELMQKMQECGQPPNDIVHELAPDLDLTNLSGPLKV